MKKLIDNIFTNNTKYKFEVRHLTYLKSFIITGDTVLIMKLINTLISNSLYADTGYIVKVYPSQNKVLLKNVDRILDIKWSRIFK